MSKLINPKFLHLRSRLLNYFGRQSLECCFLFLSLLLLKLLMGYIDEVNKIVFTTGLTLLYLHVLQFENLKTKCSTLYATAGIHRLNGFEQYFLPVNSCLRRIPAEILSRKPDAVIINFNKITNDLNNFGKLSQIVKQSKVAQAPIPFTRAKITICPENLQLQEAIRSIRLDECSNNEDIIKSDDTFLLKLLATVLENITNINFGPAQLYKHMAMSSSQLHRRLKVVTNMTPSQIIRCCRLTSARTMLLDTQLNIADISFETGFNDPAYFTRVFSHEFGISPSKFRKSATI